MISAYYVGFAIGGLAYDLPDTYGRKWACLAGLLLSCLAQTVMLLTTSFWVRTAMFFLFGLAQIKNSVSYVWLSECVNYEHKPTAFTMINVFDSMPMVVVCLYYRYISSDWFYLCFVFAVLTYIATLVLFVCPESPRWHLVNGRTSEAIQTLNYMARMNGGEEVASDAVFVEDPSNFEVKVDPKRGMVQHSFKISRNLIPDAQSLEPQGPGRDRENFRTVKRDFEEKSPVGKYRRQTLQEFGKSALNWS